MFRSVVVKIKKPLYACGLQIVKQRGFMKDLKSQMSTKSQTVRSAASFSAVGAGHVHFRHHWGMKTQNRQRRQFF